MEFLGDVGESRCQNRFPGAFSFFLAVTGDKLQVQATRDLHLAIDIREIFIPIAKDSLNTLRFRIPPTGKGNDGCMSSIYSALTESQIVLFKRGVWKSIVLLFPYRWYILNRRETGSTRKHGSQISLVPRLTSSFPLEITLFPKRQLVSKGSIEGANHQLPFFRARRRHCHRGPKRITWQVVHCHVTLFPGSNFPTP